MINDITFNSKTATMTKTFSMTPKCIEEQLMDIDYINFYAPYKKCVNDAVEKAPLPFIMLAFYHFVFVEEIIPTPRELLDEYYFLNRRVFKKINDSTILFNGVTLNKCDIDARVLRAYPSLIRDWHMLSMLNESKYFTNVFYSFVDDMNGVDITVESSGKKFVISLFVKTKRSQDFKNYKNTVRHQYGDNEIQMPLDLSTARSCGDFYLYNKSDVEYIKNYISNAS